MATFRNYLFLVALAKEPPVVENCEAMDKDFIYIYANAFYVVVQGGLSRLSPTPLLGHMTR